MAAMKPRTGDGPMEVVKEGRSYVMRVPLEGGGRLVVEITADEVRELGDALLGALNPPVRSTRSNRVSHRRSAGRRLPQAIAALELRSP